MTQVLDAQNSLLPARQTWETPRLIDLSAQQTESGKPNVVETRFTVSPIVYSYGPAATGGS